MLSIYGFLPAMRSCCPLGSGLIWHRGKWQRKFSDLKSRFEPAALDRWSLNAEYLRFLASYEKLLPLGEWSDLASREMATKIFRSEIAFRTGSPRSVVPQC